MRDDKMHIIKPFHRAKVLSVAFLVLAIFFFGMMILFLLSNQLSGMWLLINVIGSLSLFYYYLQMSQLKFVIHSLGVEVYRKNQLDYIVRWNDYSVAYFMSGSHVLQVRYVFLAYCKLSESKRMLTTLCLLFKLFKKPKFQSEFAFPMRNKDFVFVVQTIGNQLYVIDEIH